MGGLTLTERDFYRLQGFLSTLLELTGKDVFCVGYNSHREYIDVLNQKIKPKNGLLELLKNEGFCFSKKNGRDFMIFYDDLLDTEKRLEVFAHESGHGLLGHVDGFNSTKNAQTEWEADFFSAMFVFLANGALPILKSWNREHIYESLVKGGEYGG